MDSEDSDGDGKEEQLRDITELTHNSERGPFVSDCVQALCESLSLPCQPQ